MYNIKEIKQRYTCVDVAKLCGLAIRRAGDRIASPLRPGADNKTAFVVEEEFFYDFVSGEGGDCIDLLAALKYNGNKGLAIRELGEITGASADDTRSDIDWKDMHYNLGCGIKLWHESLKDEHIQYLNRRGITYDTIERLCIGYNSKLDRIIIPYEKNGYYYNYIGRRLDDSKTNTPKYYKAPKSEAPEDTPWGMDTLKRNNEVLYICEGAFDALSFEQEGCSVISSMGGHFPKRLLPMVLDIMKQFKRVVLAFDSDEAGQGFTKNFCELLCSTKITFEVLLIPEGFKDVSEYYAAGNNITTMETINGLIYIVNSIETIEDFEQFVYKISKYASHIVIDKIFEHVEQYTQWNKRTLNTIHKKSEKIQTGNRPEMDVANAVVENHQLKYSNGVGFYEYKHGCWRLVADSTIKQYIIDELGDKATNAKQNNVCGLLKTMTVEEATFNRAPVWNFINGTLELDTGIFREHRPEDLCSIQMDYPYKGNYKCPTWEKFIESVMAGSEIDMEVLQLMAGYVLFNDCSLEKIFVLTGSGSNGKTRFTMMMEEIFGFDNCTSLRPIETTQQFESIHLQHSVLNIAGEINANLSKCEERLKQIASGETISGCYKGKDRVTFVPRCKLIFATNGEPTSSDTSNGLARRLQIVHFPVSFVDHPDPNNPLEQKKDVDLIDKLRREKSGIFNWVYKGYQRLKKDKKFPESETQLKMISQFKLQSNPLHLFIEDLDRRDYDNQELYDLYKNWSERNGFKTLHNIKFHTEFKKCCEPTWKSSMRRDGKRSIRCYRCVTECILPDEVNSYFDGNDGNIDYYGLYFESKNNSNYSDNSIQ